MPHLAGLLTSLSSTYNIQVVLRLFLETLVPAAIPLVSASDETDEMDGGDVDRPCYFSLLRELLDSLELESSLADDVTRCVVVIIFIIIIIMLSSS